MDISMLIGNLAIGPLLLIFAILFRLFPSKSINMLYGYRTARSMKNQKTWEASNKLANRLLVAVAVITVLFQAVIYIQVSPSEAILWGSVLMCILLVSIIPVVERYLKRNFDSEGNAKQ